ncbi:THUMP domain-containing protein [Xylariales sp. PMI_506]|nr:THUMP domain-containing protein [Xylariales sp. PMI_506]
MENSVKRKNPPTGGAQGLPKKSKGGNGGRWQTPHHKAKLDSFKAKGRTLEVGDVGFWVTCQRTKEVRALEELVSICDEYAERMYGIKSDPAASDGDDGAEGSADIESSIEKEIDSMKEASTRPRDGDSVFDPMRMNLDCLLFMRTKAPVEPRELVRKICEDARLVTSRNQRKSRFINRFIPITLTGKATEHGVEEVAKTVLAEHFQLAGIPDNTTLDGQDVAPSYAIRFSSRAHNTLKRDDVIKQVAALIGPRHKVNLSAPDKVILIEVYQTLCGMSVVDGDWDVLKRYNLRELYEEASKSNTSNAEEKESDK